MIEPIYYKIINNHYSDSIIFLDRDGVLNKDTGYIDSIERVEILHENIQFISNYIKKKKCIKPNYVIISNQSGIARGLISIKKGFEIMDYIVNKVAGIIPISAYYFAPYHDSVKYKFLEPQNALYYRKPNPGMFIKAFNNFFSYPKYSFMFGDRISDMESALAAGIDRKNIHIFKNKKI